MLTAKDKELLKATYLSKGLTVTFSKEFMEIKKGNQLRRTVTIKKAEEMINLFSKQKDK